VSDTDRISPHERATIRPARDVLASMLAATAVAFAAAGCAGKKSLRSPTAGDVGRTEDANGAPAGDRATQPGGGDEAETPALAEGTLADGTAWRIGAVRPSHGALRAEDFVRPAGAVAVIAVAEGDRAGSLVEERTLPGDGDALALAIEEHLRRDDGSYEYLERMELRRGEDGGLYCTLVDTPDEAVVTLFPGDLVFAPTDLGPGRPSHSASPMRTKPTGDRIRRTRGAATRELELVGGSAVTVGDRTVEALVVDVAFVADLDLAKARRESRLFVVPGVGVVAEIWRETIRILGIIPREAGQTLLLLEVRRDEAPPPVQVPVQVPVQAPLQAPDQVPGQAPGAVSP
jgi:hypothetical protein